MYSRSDSRTLTLQPLGPLRALQPLQTLQPERFACSRTAPRSTEPEVFTFERVPAQATAVRSFVPIRPKKRCTRVMYPAKVRMHLPPPEKNRAKRWLLALVLVVLWQIYTEDPCAETPLGAGDGPVPVPVPVPVPESQGFPLQAAEERALMVPDSTCQTPAAGVPEPDGSRSLEQSAGKSYMVALLVYHRLGSDN